MEKTSLEKMELFTHLERIDCITRICSYRKVRIMRLASMGGCGGSI